MRFFALQPLLLPFSILCNILAQTYAAPFAPAELQKNIQNEFNTASPRDAWDQAKNLGEKLGNCADALFHQVSPDLQAALDTVNEFKETMNKVVGSAMQFQLDFESSTRTHDVSGEGLGSSLDQIFDRVVDELKKMFPSPDHAPTHDERVKMVSHTMHLVENDLIDVGAKYGMEKERIQYHLDNIRPDVERIFVIAGDLAEQHPILLHAILLTAVSIVIRKRIVLRLLGFGPVGPVKGSFATWAQRTFFGADVPAGSWFSYLQRAGMAAADGVWGSLLVAIGISIDAVIGTCGGY